MPPSPVRAAAACYDRHADFHDDIRGYIEGVFAIAGETLDRFQELKTARGLVDYPDMEQLMLRALDEPAVAERLSEEVRLLLVDEFQDTNPMQLALFMKFARFAGEVFFVGDVKQAIFRVPRKRSGAGGQHARCACWPAAANSTCSASRGARVLRSCAT